jgi:hypothetical protein
LVLEVLERRRRSLGQEAVMAIDYEKAKEIMRRAEALHRSHRHCEEFAGCWGPDVAEVEQAREEAS